MKDKYLKITKNTSILIWCLIVFCSCDFSDDANCVYFGFLKGENFLPDLELDSRYPQFDIEKSNIVYYPKTGRGIIDTYGKAEDYPFNDILLRKLHIGIYEFLVFNKATNLVKNLDTKPEDAQIFSEVEKVGNRTLIRTIQQPVYSILSVNNEIFIDDTTHCKFYLKPCFQGVTINLKISGAENLPEIKSLTATLDGVTTSRWLYNQEKGIEYATLPFEFSKIDYKSFTQSFYVLGINPVVTNMLTLTAEFDDGTVSDTDLNLDDLLNDFASDQIIMDIRVDVSPHLRITTTIIDYKIKDFGTITIL